MAAEFLIEGPEDMKKEMSFDKFMDDILVTESEKQKRRDGEDDIDENPVRKLMREVTNRPQDRTRYVKRK